MEYSGLDFYLDGFPDQMAWMDEILRYDDININLNQWFPQSSLTIMWSIMAVMEIEAKIVEYSMGFPFLSQWIFQAMVSYMKWQFLQKSMAHHFFHHCLGPLERKKWEGI